MRLMIVGQKWLAAELLAQCLHDGHHVLAVCAPEITDTRPDHLYGLARQWGIPVSGHAARLPGAAIPADCDLILSAHAHVWIGADARSKTRLGALGYHPSLLPRHRGRDAIRWAIHMREPVTGGTVYWLDDGTDTGPVAAQSWCHIRPDDTPGTLWHRSLAPMGLGLFRQVLREIDAGIIRKTPQDPLLATWEPAFARPKLSGASTDECPTGI